MRKLNFITNLKSEKIYYYMYMNIRTLEDKMICNLLCRKLFINENIIFTTKATKYIIFHKVF